MEDNDAVIKMCIKGRSPALRHVARTHRINLDWLSELCEILQDLNKIWMVFPEMMPKIMLMNSATIRHFVILVGERQALSPTPALAIGVVVAGAGVAADLLGHRALAWLPAHLQTNFTRI